MVFETKLRELSLTDQRLFNHVCVVVPPLITDETARLVTDVVKLNTVPKNLALMVVELSP